MARIIAEWLLSHWLATLMIVVATGGAVFIFGPIVVKIGNIELNLAGGRKSRNGHVSAAARNMAELEYGRLLDLRGLRYDDFSSNQRMIFVDVLATNCNDRELGLISQYSCDEAAESISWEMYKVGKGRWKPGLKELRAKVEGHTFATGPEERRAAERRRAAGIS